MSESLKFNFALSKRTRFVLQGFSLSLCAALGVQSCCEVGAVGEAESLANSDVQGCSANHAQGKMSVVLSSKVANWENNTLLSVWNGALKSFVKPSTLSLKSVDSATGDADSVRFLELDGKFGKGLGVGTRVLGTLFQEGGKGSGLLGTNTISQIQESLEVKAPPSTVESRKFNRVASFDGFASWATGELPENAYSAQSEFATNYTPAEQWSLSQTRYDDAITNFKAAAKAGKVVRVAVLDTGIDGSHPDLKDAIDPALAYNAITGKEGINEVVDKEGHGTHVAGIIVGQGKGRQSNMSADIFGVAREFNVKIVPIKVLGDDGTGSTSAMSRGIRWAMKKKVDVISMSLGSGSNYDCLRSQGLNDPAVKEAIAQGIVVVSAAGNESCELGGECTTNNTKFSNYTVLPCASTDMLCVGSNDYNEVASSFSNYANPNTTSAEYRVAPDITAPGGRILSTYPTTPAFDEYGGVAILSGTSMATPFVAGVAAILKAVEDPAKYPVNQATFKKYLQEANYQGDNYKTKFRAGRVDLKALFDNYKNKYIDGNANYQSPAVPQKVVSEFRYAQ